MRGRPRPRSVRMRRRPAKRSAARSSVVRARAEYRKVRTGPADSRISVTMSGIPSGIIKLGDPPAEVEVTLCNNSPVDYPEVGVMLMLERSSRPGAGGVVVFQTCGIRRWPFTGREDGSVVVLSNSLGSRLRRSTALIGQPRKPRPAPGRGRCTSLRGHSAQKSQFRAPMAPNGLPQ